MLAPAGASFDPVETYDATGWNILSLTNDGLVGFARAGGGDGAQLVPDLAVSLPTPTDGGRTYRFQLRKGIRYSNARAAESKRRAEHVRALVRGGFAASGLLPGDPRRRELPAPSDRMPPRAGHHRRRPRRDGDVPPHEARRRVPLQARDSVRVRPPVLVHQHVARQRPGRRLRARALRGLPGRYVGLGDSVFPARCGRALPRSGGQIQRSNPPSRRSWTRYGPVPSTGPYMVRSNSGGHLRLVRNPQFRSWSHPARPDGYADEIDIALNAPFERAVGDVERGRVDLDVALPGSKVSRFAAQHPAQVRTTPTLETFFVFLDTSRPPFDDVRARRAVAAALDRAPLVQAAGGVDGAQATCQVLPPNLQGYRPYCPFARNLAKARALVRTSRTRGARVAFWFYARRRRRPGSNGR